MGCFVNFWVIFGYVWEEIVFLKGLVKLREIRNIEDLIGGHQKVVGSNPIWNSEFFSQFPSFSAQSSFIDI